MRPFVFWLGVSQPAWLETASVPLMVSDRRLRTRRSFPRAAAAWVLDSGGFTEIGQHGRWTVTPGEYVERVRRYRDEIGLLEWAAPQDWMCEQVMLARTGLTIAEHQRRTVDNFIELRTLAPELPFIPVLQGWTRGHYDACWEQYAARGIDLTAYPLVGLGSVCRRQSTTFAHTLVSILASEGLRLHAFGMKKLALPALRDRLVSSDSHAWSTRARNDEFGTPSDRNSLAYALDWRGELLARLGIYEDDDATPIAEAS